MIFINGSGKRLEWVQGLKWVQGAAADLVADPVHVGERHQAGGRDLGCGDGLLVCEARSEPGAALALLSQPEGFATQR